MDKKSTAMTILSNIIIPLGIVIFNIYVFIKVRNGNTSLLTLCGIINVIDMFFHITYKNGKALFLLIPLFIYNSIKYKSVWIGICLALLLENILAYIFSVILFLLSLIIAFRKDD